MKKYSKIVLNIPHSSDKGILDSSWNNKNKLVENSVARWTDWYTDVIFNPSQNLKNVVFPIVFNMSRFIVDVERLENDELNDIGEGILYTSKDGFHRTLSTKDSFELMNVYHKYINSLKKNIEENTLLIDCHSFPSDLAKNIDICIGYNNDESYNEKTVEFIVNHFKKYGYRVGINTPYSNSIYPKKSFKYDSVMIEVNKNVYLLEKNNTLSSKYYFLANVINKLYSSLLNNF